MKKILLLVVLLVTSIMASPEDLRDGVIAFQNKEYDKAIAIFSKSCSDGNLDGCIQLGSMYDDNGIPDKKDYKTAISLYKKACDGQNYNGCVALDFMYKDGAGVVKDETQASNLYQNACDNNNMRGCYFAANSYKYALDMNKSIGLYKKACYGGISNACIKACEILLPNGAYEETFRLSQKAYELGDTNGYSYLGRHYQSGLGIKQDIKKAEELYKQACEKGSYLGCNNLGALHTIKDLRGIKLDYGKAIKYFEDACNKDIDSGCKNLGDMYDGGFGVEKNVDKAKELWGKSAKLYEKSCHAGNPGSCFNYAELHDNGDRVRQDYLKSAQFYKYACDWDNIVGCNNLGVKYDIGQGVEKNIDKSIAFFKKACDNKYALGCINLAKKYEFDKKYIKGALEYYKVAVELDASYKKNLDGFHKRQKEEKDEELKKQKKLASFRGSLKEGSKTNCGSVVEVKKTIVKVYFPIANYGNEHWIERDRLYPPYSGCRFLNGQYIGTGE